MNAKQWIVLPGMRKFFLDYIELIKGYLLSEDPLMNRPLLIIGDSGVGKGMFVDAARQLFEAANPDKKFMRLNCASFESQLADSELFGYVKGSFTSAFSDKDGIVSKANGGLLVLDEIGELPDVVRAKLLIFVEDNEYRRVGSNDIEKSFVKIIGTTNKGIDDFRKDFWYRFFPIFIPPLYERRLDVLYYIAFKYREVFSKLTPVSALRLLSHNWPGNMRELERVISLMRLKSERVDKQILELGNIECNLEAISKEPELLFNVEAGLFHEEMDILHEEKSSSFSDDLRQTSLANVVLEKFVDMCLKANFDMLKFNKIIRDYGLHFPYYFQTEEDAFSNDRCKGVNRAAVQSKYFTVEDGDQKKTFKRRLFSHKMSMYNERRQKFEMGAWDNYYEELSKDLDFIMQDIKDVDNMAVIVGEDNIDNIGEMLDSLCMLFLKNVKDSENIFMWDSFYINSRYKTNRSFYEVFEKISYCIVDVFKLITGYPIRENILSTEDVVVKWTDCVDQFTNFDDDMLDIKKTVPSIEDNCPATLDTSVMTENQLLSAYYGFLKTKFKTDKKASEAAGVKESTFRFRMKKLNRKYDDKND